MNDHTFKVYGVTEAPKKGQRQIMCLFAILAVTVLIASHDPMQPQGKSLQTGFEDTGDYQKQYQIADSRDARVTNMS